jgi:hypothetical protein
MQAVVALSKISSEPLTRSMILISENELIHLVMKSDLLKDLDDKKPKSLIKLNLSSFYLLLEFRYHAM